MANREELGIIRGARAGDADSQLALGKLYLFGGSGLPQSPPTALHWLLRAADQGHDDAWRLMGKHIGFEYARRQRDAVLPWYEQAWDARVPNAGLVLAQLVLPQPASAALRRKALHAVSEAADEGHPDALRLLAQQAPDLLAEAGITGAWPRPDRFAELDAVWRMQPRAVFLAHALPLARSLVQDAPVDADAARGCAWHAPPRHVELLSRCARSLAEVEDRHGERQRFCELAAHGGDRSAQLALGLWHARMTCDGARVSDGNPATNFKRAVRWLTEAGEQGLAEAWFALARIYIKAEFSQRSVAEAQACLERAADMGHSAAQLECGIHAWRTRRDDEQNDVRAAFWLMKAAAQGSREAQAALARIAPEGQEADWVTLAPHALPPGQPRLAARLELALLFQLSRPEALLVDVRTADRGHCLVVDIRASYGRSKRRLVLVRTRQQRQALDRMARMLDLADAGGGPEGNYRQRLYRLKQYMPGGDAPALQPA